jgi:hypothetical protein
MQPQIRIALAADSFISARRYIYNVAAVKEPRGLALGFALLVLPAPSAVPHCMVQGAADESGAVGWLSAFALASVGQPILAVRLPSEISNLQFEITAVPSLPQ